MSNKPVKYKQWIEVSSKAINENLKGLQKMIGEKEILVVVKANAYGHGIKEISSLAYSNGVRWFGVDNIDEALILREHLEKDTKILVLGYTPMSRLEEAVKNKFSLTVYNLETIQIFKNIDPKLIINVHLKIESGMNRQGILPADLPKVVNSLKSLKNVVIEGISTHFAEPEDNAFTSIQINSFLDSLKSLNSLGIKSEYVHTSASSAALYTKEAPGNLVRVGRAVYGFIGDFLPVMTWKSVVAQVKTIEVGQSVGYGHAWTASKKTKIAVIPIGYSDGFDRKLSNCGRVLIQGEYANVVGRVAMNMFMVDITHIANVNVEDEVVIIGKQGNNTISIEELADKAQTIAHEIVARLNPNIHKIIV